LETRLAGTGGNDVMNRVYLLLGAVALALCVGPSAALAQQDSMGSGMSSGSTMASTEMRSVDWSRRYELTPIEHKRLRALGLTNKEVFAVANAARLSRRSLEAPSFDDPAQMILRGRAEWQIARDLNVPATALDDRQPEWETAEWETAVDEGWFTYRQGATMSTTTTTTTETRPNR
jgi:hypothetical protein